jgi:eukaryotic-like serine/threonine-protein kinase
MTDGSDAQPYRDEPTGLAKPRTEADGLLLALLLKHQRQSWRRGEPALVETYVAQQPALQADAQTVLDLIYNEILLREQAGEAPGLEEYLRRFPELADELRLQFEIEDAIQVQTSVDAGEEPTVVDGRVGGRVPRVVPAVPGYEILGELGRGGMGVVYKARQLRLNRIVALKMILAGDHASPEASLRFMAEAESIARLHHPNIVQIFAFGDCDGRPYFEMEYVAGGGLSDRLGGAPWTPRDAARLVETAARAIHQAHQMSIVHRDLKPANILLTVDGIPKIADFGLAKCLETETGLTRSDWIVGSPSYMAPEQARGSGGRIGPVVDVYSLGAILYALLTGRPPFQAATVLETLEQVQWDEPIAPSRLRPKLPRDLVTICLKCLEKEPAKRYPSAVDLAEDLARFAAGETIRARPVGWHERLFRWCRREPAVAALAITLLVGLVGVATQWRRAESHLADALVQRRRAEDFGSRQVATIAALQAAKNLETKGRDRAQRRFDATIDALRRFDELTNDPALLRDSRLEELRGKFLNASLRFYKELQASLEGDASPDARTKLSDAYTRVADLSWELGLNNEALAAHQQSLALLERLAAITLPLPGLRAAVARGHSRIGFTLRTTGRWAEALDSYERARAIQEALARDYPDELDNRATLSWTLSNIGLIHQEIGRPDEAIRLHRRAIGIHEALFVVNPASMAIQSDLAFARRYLGQSLAAEGDFEQALRNLRLASKSLERLVGSNLSGVEERWRLARCRDEIGSILLRTRGTAAADEPLQQANDVLEALTRDNPTLYRIDLARNLIYVASQRALTGRPAETMANIQRAEGLLARCTWVPPRTLYDLACAYSLWCGSVRAGADATATATRESPGDPAIATLRRAVAGGLRSVDQLRRDPALDPIRGRADFRSLINDVAFPDDVFTRASAGNGDGR